MKIAIIILAVAWAGLLPAASRADSLHYFKNYFVTGDYTVAGVGLYGKGNPNTHMATGTINMTTVPNGADIIAAFLYWQTEETGLSPSAINGTFDGNAIVGDAIGANPAAACWTPAGTTGPAGSFARVYRADVLRYLPINSALNIRVADGTHTVVLPDSGNAAINYTPHTNGATLVVIYRMLPLLSAPYKAVVIYDGAATLTRSSTEFSQLVGGFYQAAGSGAKMTHIVGNGQSGDNVELMVNGAEPPGVEDNIFSGAQGARWDNPTFNINLGLNASSLTTQVLAENAQTCLSWGAVVMSTNVVDSDGDGLLDTWESNGLHLNIGTPTTPATFGGCKDYPADPCENFPAMGAVNGVRDIFVQIDWMAGTDTSVSPPYQHIHVPKLAALQNIANVFASHGLIAVHFDVGSHYQQKPALPFIVPAAYAKGGNQISESLLECPPANFQNASCEYSELGYSAIGWKKGLEAVANGFSILGIPQYFPHDRKDTFHYVLMGHALAGPFNAAGMPETKVPSSVSGVADTPGGDLLVTLGLWAADDPANCVLDDPTGVNQNICINETGTALQQAGTIMHELGHNLGLYHAGGVNNPNCMPDYPSVMNYLYQTRGLTDAQGNEHIDFSFGLLNPLDENALNEKSSMGILLYRVRYWAPANSAEAGAVDTTFYCNGTPVPGGAPGEVRLETPGLQTPDWNNNGKVDSSPVAVDINFNGTTGNVTADSVEPSDLNKNDPKKLWFIDHPDWLTLNLQQIGGRSNTNGLSDDISAPDLGQSDLGQSDLGQSDLGQSDLGQSDLGQSDLGQSDLGQSDLGDVDYDTVVSTLDATSASAPLVATVTASTGTAYNQVTLTWGAPSVGQIRKYTIYRTNTSTLTTVVAGTVTGTPPLTSFNDVVNANDNDPYVVTANCSADLCYDTAYTYYITSSAGNTTSTPSNTVSATVDHFFVTAYSGSVVYGNTLPNFGATAATINGLPSGGITSSAFTCTNTTGSVPPRNVGAYTITCTGPATVGTGNVYGVTYITGTLTITQRPLTIAAGTCTKTYDGTTTAPAAGTCSAAAVTGLAPAPWEGYTDTVSPIVEMYQSANVMGTGGSTVYVSSYTVNDENGGGNYSVPPPIKATGTINPAPLLITPSGTQVYGSNTQSFSAMFSGFVNGEGPGVLGGPLTCADTANSMSPVGNYVITSCLGYADTNYNFTYMYALGVFSVTPAPLTIDVAGTQIYGGVPSYTITNYATLVNGDTSSVFNGQTLACTTNATNTSAVANNYSISCSGLIDTNYNITYSGTLSVTPAQLTVIVTGTAPSSFAVAGSFPNDSTVSLSGTLMCNSTATDASGNPIVNCSGITAPNYTILYVYGATSGGTTLYTTDATLADFTTVSTYATFLAGPNLSCDGCTLPFTPTGQPGDQLTSGDRVYPSVDGASIVVQFPLPVSSVRVFPSIDHYGTAYDGYQYSIYGSNDGTTWIELFDTDTVVGAGEPFTLGTFFGTAPVRVNHVLTNVGPGGVGTVGVSSNGQNTVGYEADFTFPQAYTFYQFGPSTEAVGSGNQDQELSGVASLP